MTPQTVEFFVNGEAVRLAVEPRMHLGDCVRRELGLTGTHLSCEHGVCGACTVLIDGVPQRSCITYAVACEGAHITTVEGYGDDPVMAALRAAFHEHHALQCGYCTPGMLCTARDIVLRLDGPDARRVRHELSGNLCRCTGYVGIVDAIESVLAKKAAGELAMPQVEAAKPVVAASVADDWVPIDIPADGEWIEVKQSLSLPMDEAAAWAKLKDLALVANCLPGAQIERNEGQRATGVMNIKFGPITAAFAMRAELVTDDARRTGAMRAEGVDRRSATRVKTLLDYAVGAGVAGGSAVDLMLRFRLAGRLAQFSRAGLVNDYVAELTRAFGRNLAGAASCELQPARAEAPGLFALLMARLRRLFA
jgi:carbon-monoxide dehydrogenase small subunit